MAEPPSSWIARAAAAGGRLWRAAARQTPLPGTGPLSGPAPVIAPPIEPASRKVTLRADRDGGDSRHLEAYLDGEGNLHLDGQDLGPATAMVSDDGEYEWFETIAAADVPRLLALLGGQPGDDILEVLERDFTGKGSYDLEKRLRESGIPRHIHVW